MLPSTIQMKTNRGDQEIEVVALAAHETPDHDGGAYRDSINRRTGWDGHTASTAGKHLTTWTLPERSKKIAERVERALEDGIPDQRRCMIRNLDNGILEDRFITDIAMGEDLDRPYAKWSKKKTAEARVAICMDVASGACDSPELLRCRTTVAAGLTSALEACDFEVSVVGGAVRNRTSGYGRDLYPRQDPNSYVMSIVVKDESEPFVESAFAHFADTGFRRLISCWVAKSNGYSTALSDSEWRELTGADLFIYIGNTTTSHCTYGIPSDEKIGPRGPDTLVLNINTEAEIEASLVKIESFFQDLCGE